MNIKSKVALQSIPQKYTVIAQILTFLWLSSIFILSLASFNNKSIQVEWKHVDKIVHFGFYFGLEVLLLAAEHLRKKRRLLRKETAFLTLAVFLVGLLIEMMQLLFLTRRSGEWGDLAANTSGILTALLFMYLIVTFFITDHKSRYHPVNSQ